MAKIPAEDLALIFDKMFGRLQSEIDGFVKDECKFLDVEDYCTLQSTVQIIGELFIATRKHSERFREPIDKIMSLLINLLKDERYQIDTAFSDVVIGMLKIHILTIQSKFTINYSND